MKNISKIVALFGVAAPLLTFGVTPDQPASTNSGMSANDKLQALFADSVVAKGKGIEVKRNDLDNEVVNTRATMAARNMQVPPDADLDVQALRGLIAEQLVLNKATEADRAQAKSQFDARIAELKASSGLSDDELFKRLSQQRFAGETREQWEKQNIDIATFPIVLQREMGVKVSDEDVKKFYDDPENLPQLEEAEKVRVSHILLVTSDLETHQPLSDADKAKKHKLMEDLLKRARAGEDFAKLADQNSEDPGVKQNHGEYTLTRDDPYVPEFKTTAFSLTNGQVSDIIESRYGYHILKLSEKIPAKKVEFEKVKDQIKNLLVQTAIQKQFGDYMNKLAKDAKLEVTDDKLKAAETFPDQKANVDAPKTGAGGAGAAK